jgi:hypothetical protein
MDPETPQRDLRAPEGAHCAEHPDRQAHFTCARCGSYACITCWHPSIERCQQCLKRDPTEAAPPIPWEQPAAAVPVRFFATLATALRPVRSAPAFAREDVGVALRFALLSALPCALLAGIIPHTRTLLFAGNFQVKVLGHADQGAIALDVARAMGVQLVLSSVELLCLMLPFVSLVRAYAPARSHAAARMMLYRFWLLPGAVLLFYLAVWGLPPGPPTDAGEVTAPPGAQALLLLLGTFVPVLLFVAMGSTARLACGLGPLLSIVVVIVPVLLLLLVKPLAAVGIESLLPPIGKPPG